MNAYKAFGLSISCDLRLPELRQINTDVQNHSSDICNHNFDIRIFEGRHSAWPPFTPSKHSTETLAMARSEWRLELEGIGWFRAWGGNQIAWERWDENVSDRDLSTFLVTSALGALLVQRGLLLLNATTLSLDDKAVMFLGCPVAGKSTLAWCLLEKGWKLVSSEISIVNHDGLVWPGLQQLKLWQNSAEALGIDCKKLPVVRSGLKRYSLLPPLLPTSNQPAPLSAIYTITRLDNTAKNDEKHSPDQNTLLRSPCSIAALPFDSQRDALLTIRNQVFHPRFYRAMACEAGLFTQASNLVRHYPGYILQVPEGVKRMSNALAAVDLLNPESILGDISHISAISSIS